LASCVAAVALLPRAREGSIRVGLAPECCPYLRRWPQAPFRAGYSSCSSEHFQTQHCEVESGGSVLSEFFGPLPRE